ncbi:MAG: DUF4810 domain-containing protein [Bacteroidales bacterium]|nr:DUF4810 domain-containing protein [Bacteroidales bacterium]MBR5782257.1 DUF4810 domain-containing protein [Bacteroidales bacterium]
MRKLLAICASAMLLSSCVPTSMYYWGKMTDGVSKYEQLTYKHYDQQTPESICELLVLYEDMVSNPGGSRNTVPPGICAEYGFLMLQPNTAEIFEMYATPKQKKAFENSEYGALFSEKGIKMLEMEMELYPESVTFIGPILKRLK